MDLYNNPDLFNDLIRRTSDYFGIAQNLIEKDYYVCLFLKEAVLNIPGLVFKGGTSLSKCFKLINRFSEDIDLTLDLKHSSQSFKRNAIRELIRISELHPFNHINKDEIKLHTHSNYNCLNVEYESLYNQNVPLKSEIKIEMTYLAKCYPHETSSIISYIGEFLKKENRNDLVEKYSLNSFQINVQSLNRTLIDKVFAICDYYLRNEFRRNSRHIYDINKLINKVTFNKDFKNLVQQVREERQKNLRNASASNGVSINKGEY